MKSLTCPQRPVPYFRLTAEEMSHGEDEDAMDECEFEITSTEGPVDAETQKFDTIISARLKTFS